MDNKLVLSVDKNSAPVKLVYFKVYSYDATETVNLEYDDRGNLIKDKHFSYSWDPENRPSEIKDTLFKIDSQGNKNFPTVKYIYDAFGRRVVTKYKYGDTGKKEWKFFITVYDGILPIPLIL